MNDHVAPCGEKCWRTLKEAILMNLCQMSELLELKHENEDHTKEGGPKKFNSWKVVEKTFLSES